MKLKAEIGTGGSKVFRDETGEVIYTLSETAPSCEGSLTERARRVVSEYITLDMVIQNPTTSGSGWASSMMNVLSNKKTQLRISLMDICANEFLKLTLMENKNVR